MPVSSHHPHRVVEGVVVEFVVVEGVVVDREHGGRDGDRGWPFERVEFTGGVGFGELLVEVERSEQSVAMHASLRQVAAPGGAGVPLLDRAEPDIGAQTLVARPGDDVEERGGCTVRRLGGRVVADSCAVKRASAGNWYPRRWPMLAVTAKDGLLYAFNRGDLRLAWTTRIDAS